MGERQTLPRLWLVTDERQGERLLPAVTRLPSDAGILFRHYGLDGDARRSLFDRVRADAGSRMLLLAGPPTLAASWGADGWHGWGEGAGPHSVSVHNEQEIRRAETIGADLAFLAPVHPTRSHPGGRTLGVERFAALAAMTRMPIIALGGVTHENAPDLIERGAYGWGAVDAWSG